MSSIVEPGSLPVHFYAFAVSCALGTLGLMTFGVISYHFVEAGLLTAALVPVVYAVAMAAEAVAAVVTGLAYDRWGAGVLFSLPIMIVAVPALTLANILTIVLVGVLVWGAATGVKTPR